MLDHYERGEEQDRLASPQGRIELLRTLEIFDASLPEPPATIADVGGGPGRHAVHLAAAGYRVVHRDAVPLHVQQLCEEARRRRLRSRIDAAVGDARALDLPSSSVDAVLLLGPLYHLPLRADRLRALRECARIVKPGGVILAAAISRWAPRLHGELVLRMTESIPGLHPKTLELERTGVLPALRPGSFTGYCHRPQQLRSEIRAAGLQCVDLVGLEGLSFAVSDLEARLDDDVARGTLLDAARELQRVPELLGLSPHLLATGRRPLRSRRSRG